LINECMNYNLQMWIFEIDAKKVEDYFSRGSNDVSEFRAIIYR